MLGIRVPVLRKLAQDIVKEDNYDWKSQLIRCKYDVNVTISDGE